MQKPKLPSIYELASAENFGRIASALKFSLIAVVIVAVYFQDLSIVFNSALHDEATFHILAIPFLFAYLLYRKRKMISATTNQKNPNTIARTRHIPTLIGSLLSATALILYWYGSYTFTPLEYHMFTLPFFTAGLVLILFNVQTLKQLLFPIAFLIFLAPPPVEILYSVGSSLSVLSSEASNALANLFGVSSSISNAYGNPILTITRPDQSIINFTVDVACSGIYSLIGFVIFAVFIAYITRSKIQNKLAILIMGVPLIITLNIIRITTILAIGYHYGEQLALQVFHTVGATVLMFLGTLLLLGITEKLIKKPKPQQPCPNCNPTTPNTTDESCPNCGKLLRIPKTKLRRNDLAKIATIATIVGLLLLIQAPVFALTEGPAQVIIQTPTGEQGNTEILPQMPNYSIQYVYRDKNFEQISDQDASLIYAYTSTDKAKPTVWVGIEVAPTISSLHRWEVCLITWPLSQGNQLTVTQIDLRDTQTLSNPPITARYFAFQYQSTNSTQLVLYWYETSTFTVNGTSQQKHVKISLITYPKTPEQVPEAETQLLPFATAINNYWQPIKAWTQISLAISQNGLTLSTATTALIAATIVYWQILNTQKKHSLQILYGKLPEQDQQLLDAIRITQKTGNPTTTNIATQLQQLTKTNTPPEQLQQKLEETANTGLITKTITNNNDEPTTTWKTQLPTPKLNRNDHIRRG
jgi:exosortase